MYTWGSVQCCKHVLCVPRVGTAARCPRGGARTVQMWRCGVCVAKACDPVRNQNCSSLRIKDVRNIKKELLLTCLTSIILPLLFAQQVKVIFSQRWEKSANRRSFAIYILIFFFFYAGIHSCGFHSQRQSKKGPNGTRVVVSYCKNMSK